MPPPTVRSILASYVQALGGRAAYQRVTSRVSRGSVTISGANIDIEQIAKAPDQWRTRIAGNTPDAIVDGCDGAVRWEATSRGTQRLSADALTESRVYHTFYRDIRLDTNGIPRRTVRGQSLYFRHGVTESGKE